MTSAPVESGTWPLRRWVFVVSLILAGQLGLIFWLSARKIEAPRLPLTSSRIYLPIEQTADLPGVSDPTLFILPKEYGFSGPAWLQIPRTIYNLEPWTEAPRPLGLALQQLGTTLGEFVRSNLLGSFQLITSPEPSLDTLGYLPVDDLAATQSTLSIEGDLANRPLLSDFKLESWTSPEILTNSVVQIAVDGAGRVFSAVLLVKCASAEANASALNQAKSARFEPLQGIGRPVPGGPDRLDWGKIIFQWHTIVPPPTNAVPFNK